MWFHVTNKALTDLLTCSRYHQLLLSEGIQCRKKRLRQLITEYDLSKQEPQYQLPPIDYMHVWSLFPVSNDKVIRKNDKVHDKKLQKLIPDVHETSIIDNISHDPHLVSRFACNARVIVDASLSPPVSHLKLI